MGDSQYQRVTTRETSDHLEAVMGLLRAALTPELLREPYRTWVEQEGAHPVTGHCYVATEALFHLLGGKAAGWTPMHQQHEGGPHWWLRGPSGEVVDPTAAQFSSPVPYELGKGKGFLTREPSKRAQIVIRRVMAGQPTTAADRCG